MEEKKKEENGSDSRCSDGQKSLIRELKLVSPTLVISCLVAKEGSFWFTSNLRAVFIDDQGLDPVFRDINFGPLGYPCVALVTTKRGWASSLPVAMVD